MQPISLHFASQLLAPAAEVWSAISTMAGVNAELMPLVRMTCPPEAAARSLESAPLGEVALHSYLLLFGVLPFDRHALTLLEILPGEGFIEDSTSLLQRRWRHERHVVPSPTGGGCILTDELLVLPRVAALAPLVRPLVRSVFDHRHRRLHRRFGGVRTQ